MGRMASAPLCMAAAGTALLLGGCDQWKPLSPLSAAASMRVEVEVYKGPLAQPIPSQYAELAGALVETRTAIYEWSKLAKIVAMSNRCPSHPLDEKCRQLNDAQGQADIIVNLIESNLCKSSLQQLDCQKIKLIANKNVPNTLLTNFSWGQLAHAGTSDQREQFLAGAVEIAARMRAKAFYTTYDQLPALPHRDVRTVLLGWTTLTSSYSNEIDARATTLLKQIRTPNALPSQPEMIEGSKLSVGDHLKNANPSDFLHLLDWYKTIDPRQAKRDGLSDAGRVRLGQRLFSDQYWSKVNEVHANGQGDVRMAFIRDGIGNWNLKSFDNNPEELLAAYREITLAGVNLAKEVAETAIGKKPGTELLGTANRLINNKLGGDDDQTTDDRHIDALRDRLFADIKQAQKEIEGAKKAFDQELAAAEAERERLNARKTELEKPASNAAGTPTPVTPAIAGGNTTVQEEPEEQGDNKTVELAVVLQDLDRVVKKIGELKTAHASTVERIIGRVEADIQSHLTTIDGLKKAEVAKAPDPKKG